MTPPPEHDYIGIGLSSASSSSDGSSAAAVLKTELRLGLPGSESQERATGPPALTLALTPRSGSGSKRGFSDSSPKWVFGSEPKPKDEQLDNANNKLQPNNNPAPAAKVQVVGWPPIRNFRKNTMANTNTNTNADTNLLNSKKKKEEEGEGKQGWGCMYVKVSMDGAPYLRKVDLKMYSNYKNLSLALQKMFSCFTIGQCGSHGIPARDGQGESRLTDNGSENVLTYEDKDGDWMLVGDVPWDMFTETCRRLRIMKGSDAIGLAPRATGKSKNQN